MERQAPAWQTQIDLFNYVKNNIHEALAHARVAQASNLSSGLVALHILESPHIMLCNHVDHK